MIYENCLIQAPDGANLSRCSYKKIRWYIDRNMADLVSDDPPTIRLRFEPSGRTGANDPLLLAGKPNICVVCGSNEELTRHHIIPYRYVRYMPLKYKADIIHDIFPLCRPCHNRYEKIVNNEQVKWAKENEVHLSGVNKERFNAIRKAVGSAKALLKHSQGIPLERKQELMKCVQDFLKKEDITQEDLSKLSKRKVADDEEYYNISKSVVKDISDYNEFAKKWRLHFLEKMQPQHMPLEWRFDRKSDEVYVPQRMLKQNHEFA